MPHAIRPGPGAGGRQRVPLLALIALLLGAPSLAAQGSAVTDTALHWVPAPGLFPRGARRAIISGNPFKAELLTVLLALPDGYRMPPHLHPADEHVQVREGTFLVGTGRTVDLRKAAAMVRGDTVTAPGGAAHWAVAKGRPWSR